MDIISLLVMSVGLAMDASAVSICKGLALKKPRTGEMLLIGGWFGFFQALMPLIGYFLGSTFAHLITGIDHWIAFALLCYVGGNMIWESRHYKCDSSGADLTVKTMFLLAVATSIDALAVGITLAFLDVNIWFAAAVIGLVTFILSVIGTKIGSLFGTYYGAGAELVGGITLVVLGLKILLEHLSII